MAGRLIDQIAAVAIGIAMLATPALALPVGGCGGSCCQPAVGEIVPASAEPVNCCSSSSLRVETKGSTADGQALRCHLCCENSPLVPPSVPPLRDGRLDLSV